MPFGVDTNMRDIGDRRSGIPAAAPPLLAPVSSSTDMPVMPAAHSAAQARLAGEGVAQGIPEDQTAERGDQQLLLRSLSLDSAFSERAAARITTSTGASSPANKIPPLMPGSPARRHLLDVMDGIDRSLSPVRSPGASPRLPRAALTVDDCGGPVVSSRTVSVPADPRQPKTGTLGRAGRVRAFTISGPPTSAAH